MTTSDRPGGGGGEAAVARPNTALVGKACGMTDHSLSVTLYDRDVLLEVECHALPVSLCRQVCAVDCGAEEWPCGPEDAPHPMRRVGDCQALPYLVDDSVQESCSIKRRRVRLYDGMEIELDWTAGSGYTWRPA